MKKILTLICMTLVCLVEAQDQITLTPLACGDNGDVRYIAIGDRQSMIKINRSWPANETRPVTMWINNSLGVPVGDIPGGENFITLGFPDTEVSPIMGYHSIYIFSLQVGDGLYSEDLGVHTEPTPIISVAMNVTPVQDGEMIAVTGSSYTADTAMSDYDGWGQVGPQCSLHQLIIVTEVVSIPENALILSDTVICEPGVPTQFSAEVFYQGPYTELGVRSRMEKRSLEVPEGFPTQVIVSSEEFRTFVGTTTGQEDLSKDQSPFLVFPNPALHGSVIRASKPVAFIFDVLGQAVPFDKKNIIIETPGVYTLVSIDKTVSRQIVE